jgi:type II secretory pathway pseudopilin PulG
MMDTPTIKARRHRGIRHGGQAAARSEHAASLAPSRRRAFSLVEVLLAIFILGIGVISIAALFPAGIAQQRLSNDDLVGPMVANNAIEIIRSKVKPEDFGSFEQFGIPTNRTPRPTVLGDWCWLRPGVLFADDNTWPIAPNPPLSEKGAIDIFSYYYNVPGGPIGASRRASEFPTNYQPPGNERLFGVPYNTFKYGVPSNGGLPPRILITQAERYYPMISRQHAASNEPYKPQYVWDCMFRRFDGKIYVAIFVYRVTIPGGGTAANFVVAPNQGNNFPPVPIWLNLVADPAGGSPPAYSAGGAWDVGGPGGAFGPTSYEDDAIVLGTQDGTLYNPDDATHAWQEPRQWMIDQNNNIYRVVGQTRESYDDDEGDVEVELVRPLAPVLGRVSTGGQSEPTLTPYFYRPQQAASANWQYGFVNTDIVTDIWYIPLTMKYDSDGDGVIEPDDGDATLTPVYATVKEL